MINFSNVRILISNNLNLIIVNTDQIWLSWQILEYISCIWFISLRRTHRDHCIIRTFLSQKIYAYKLVYSFSGLFIRVACNTFCASSNRELVSVLRVHRYLYPIVYICVCVCVYAERYRVLPFGFTRSYRRDITPSPLISDDTAKAESYPFADTSKITWQNFSSQIYFCSFQNSPINRSFPDGFKNKKKLNLYAFISSWRKIYVIAKLTWKIIKKYEINYINISDNQESLCGFLPSKTYEFFRLPNN